MRASCFKWISALVMPSRHPRKLLSIPVPLEDLLAPQLRSYPSFTVVAEKYHAIWPLGMANIRMKDYFDLWVLMTEGRWTPQNCAAHWLQLSSAENSCCPAALLWD